MPSDFFNENIIPFSGPKDHTSHHTHTTPHDHYIPFKAPAMFFYEWNASENKWIKTDSTDPEPDQNALPPGQFDGQIIEV